MASSCPATPFSETGLVLLLFSHPQLPIPKRVPPPAGTYHTQRPTQSRLPRRPNLQKWGHLLRGVTKFPSEQMRRAWSIQVIILGRKAMTKLDNALKSRDIPLPTKDHRVKAMVFPVVMDGCKNWTIKKAEHQRTDALNRGVGEDS